MNNSVKTDIITEEEDYNYDNLYGSYYVNKTIKDEQELTYLEHKEAQERIKFFESDLDNYDNAYL